MTELEQRAAVMAEARSWIGTPFHDNAAVKGAGVSCGALLIGSYMPMLVDAGRPIPRPPVFARDWFHHAKEERFLEIVQQFTREIYEPQPGDLALFRLRPDCPFSHGVLVIEWPHVVIHSMWRSTVQCCDASQSPLKDAQARFFSPWGIE